MGSDTQNQMTILTDSSDSWNRNHIWFMLVESESESFGIVRSGILNRDGALFRFHTFCVALRLIQT